MEMSEFVRLVVDIERGRAHIFLYVPTFVSKMWYCCRTVTLLKQIM